LRRNQLLAAGVSVALLLGAATPALAKPNKGKALGHQNNTPADSRPAKGPKPPQPKPKPPKKTPAAKSKLGVSGGGSVGTGEFSIQARNSRLSKGHFNYTAPGLKVRCRGFESGDVTFSPLPAPTTANFNTSEAPNADCVTIRADGLRRPATVVGTFTDGGQPSETEPPTPGPDSVDFTVSDGLVPVEVAGPVTGNIKVRP
jgi:hypothetical protein